MTKAGAMHGSTMEVLRHLAQHGSTTRDDLYRLISANHASKFGVHDVIGRLLRSNLIRVGLVELTDAGRKALESATETTGESK